MANGQSGTATTTGATNLRANQASTSAPIAAVLQTGSTFAVQGTVQGESVSGNPLWYAGMNNLYIWSGACSFAGGGSSGTATGSGTTPSGTLAGNVVGAPPGTIGFDCDFTLTASDVAGYVSQGYKFCIRYITRAQPTEQSGDLTTSEANTILNGGLALMAVQHVAASPWNPTGPLGTQYGNNAVSCAQEVGLPPGMNLWVDLEGVASGTSSQDVIDYCNAWAAPVAAAGYVPGLYVGADAILNSDELYWDISYQHYWRSGSSVPDVAVRGYQLFQRIGGGDIDQDATKTDNLGGTVLWLTRN
ncbi:MAG: glycoside hydrolase domain-containing protein [Rhizomicrobium sp.]